MPSTSTLHIGPQQPQPPLAKEKLHEASTALSAFPQDVTFTPWEKVGRKFIPVRKPAVHISQLIGPRETVILASFADVMGVCQKQMRTTLSRGKELGLPTLMVVGTGTENFLSAALTWAQGRAIFHDRREHMNREVIFVPSDTTRRLLGIGREGMVKTRNALVLIRDHHIVARWVDSYAGSADSGMVKPTDHDWNNILQVLFPPQDD